MAPEVLRFSNAAASVKLFNDDLVMAHRPSSRAVDHTGLLDGWTVAKSNNAIFSPTPAGIVEGGEEEAADDDFFVNDEALEALGL